MCKYANDFISVFLFLLLLNNKYKFHTLITILR